MINKVFLLLFGNIKLIFIKLFHFKSFKYNIYNNVSVLSKLEINNRGKLRFGKKFILKRNSRLSSSGGVINIGNYCGINSNCYIVSHSRIDIGDNVIIGPNVVIVDHNHQFNKNGIDKKEFKSKEIIIKNGAWIGANCVILKGVTIGKNSIISAGSVVNCDVPDNMIFSQKRDNEFIEIK